VFDSNVIHNSQLIVVVLILITLTYTVKLVFNGLPSDKGNMTV